MYLKLVSDFRDIDLIELRPPGFQKNIKAKTAQHVEMVRKKHGWRNVSSCPVCKTREREPELTSFGISIVRCNSCKVRYATKVPLNPSDFYDGEVYLDHARDSYMKNVEFRKKRFGTERLEIISRHLPDSRHTPKRLLDVGCGTGWFIEIVQESGYEVQGIELGKELRDWTRKRLNVVIWDCTLSEIPETETYDAITMFDLIEHVADPVKLLRDARERLNPEGIILVFTPNYDSLGITLMKENSSQIAPVDHLVYFTPPSISKAAELAKLKIIFLETKGMDIADIAASEEESNSSICQYLKNNFNVLQPIVDAAGCANHMRIIFKAS
ncbi:MAG: class I SAM-dependent methyltransferase [Candidatus Scalinduaceae bacterium]